MPLQVNSGSYSLLRARVIKLIANCQPVQHLHNGVRTHAHCSGLLLFATHCSALTSSSSYTNADQYSILTAVSKQNMGSCRSRVWSLGIAFRRTTRLTRFCSVHAKRCSHDCAETIRFGVYHYCLVRELTSGPDFD